MRSSAFRLLCLGALLGLAACSPATPSERMMEEAIEAETGEDADVDVDGDTVRIETGDGTITVGSATVPDEWPEDVPVYEGASVQYAATASPEEGKDGATLGLLTEDDAETVAAFYRTQLEANGWKIEASMQAAGATIFSAVKDVRVLALQVAAGSGDGDGKTAITIGVSKQ